MCRTSAAEIVFMTRGARLLRIAPLTIAVSCGPALDIVQYLAARGDVGATRLSQAIRGVLLIAMLVTIRRARTVFIDSRTVQPIVALGCCAALWALMQRDATEAIVFFFRTGLVAAVFLCAHELAAAGEIGRRWAERVAWAVVLTVIGSQAAGHFLHVISVYEGSFAFPGITGQPSIIAAPILAVFPVFLWRTPLRGADAIGVTLCLVSLAATQRRSALVGAAVALAIYGAFALTRMTLRSAVRLGGLLAMATVALYGLLALTPAGAELAERFQDLNFARGGTASGRSEFQRIAVERILDRDPIAALIGEGFGEVRRALARTFDLAIGAHNDWIDIVYAFGALGAVLFAAFHVRLVQAAVRARRDDTAVTLMSIGALVVVELTAGGALDPTFAPVFALFGLVTGRSRSRERVDGGVEGAIGSSLEPAVGSSHG